MSTKALNSDEIKAMKERVRWAIGYICDNCDMTNEKIGKDMGCATSTINSYRRMITVPGMDFSAYMKKFNISSDWLDSGKGEPFPGAREKYPDVCGPEGFNGVREIMAGYGSGEYVFIKQVNGRISAGGGLAPDNSSDVLLSFRREWLQKKGDPNNMSLIKVSGDSMAPTLLSGDLVLIDHSRTSVSSPGGIYAISIDHEILIKRLQLIYQDGKILVISDNKQYPPQEINSDKIIINGKVIWYARDLER